MTAQQDAQYAEHFVASLRSFLKAQDSQGVSPAIQLVCMARTVAAASMDAGMTEEAFVHFARLQFGLVPLARKQPETSSNVIPFKKGGQ